ncbi:hypothetical protein Tco_0698888 [Tanacetum coccineum]
MVLNSPCFTVKSWLVQDQTVPVQKQTVFGKDKSNPLIVDSLLKTIRFSIHLVVYNEELAIPEQTATGKGISNPLMAGSLPKTTKPTYSPNTGFKPLGDDEKKITEKPGKEGGDPSKEGKSKDHEKEDDVNRTNNINAVSSTVNAADTDGFNGVDENIVIGCVDDPTMPELEEIGRFSDVKDNNTGADMNNLDTYFQVSPVTTTRIHKHHPLNQVIGDLQSST